MCNKIDLLKQMETAVQDCGFETEWYYDSDNEVYDVLFYYKDFGGWVFETRECRGGVCYQHVYASLEEMLEHVNLEHFTYKENEFTVYW